MAAIEKIRCVDRFGWHFELAEIDSRGLPDLVEMYGRFSPRAISQGLPPAHDRDLRQWIDKLIAKAMNFVAWQDGQPVGHAAIVHDLDRLDGEYIVFVIQPYRNRGLGSALTALAMDKARAVGLKCVWLTVEAYNFRAIKVYRKAGFRFSDEGERERTMFLGL